MVSWDLEIFICSSQNARKPMFESYYSEIRRVIPVIFQQPYIFAQSSRRWQQIAHTLYVSAMLGP